MFKTIARWFCPSADSLSEMSAAQIAKQVNESEDGRQAAIAKYATLGQQISEKCNEVSAMLSDGKIDAAEEKRLAELLKPIMAAGRELILGD